MKKIWSKNWLKEDIVYPNAFEKDSDWILINPKTSIKTLEEIKKEHPKKKFKFLLKCNPSNYKPTFSIKNKLIKIFNHQLKRYEKMINLERKKQSIIRKYLTKNDIKFFTNIELSQRGDYMSFRKSGLNEYLSKEVWNRIYVVNMKNLYNKKNDKLFGRINQNISLSKKFGFRFILATFSKSLNQRVNINDFEFINSFQNDLKKLENHLLK